MVLNNIWNVLTDAAMAMVMQRRRRNLLLNESWRLRACATVAKILCSTSNAEEAQRNIEVATARMSASSALGTTDGDVAALDAEMEAHAWTYVLANTMARVDPHPAWQMLANTMARVVGVRDGRIVAPRRLSPP